MAEIDEMYSELTEHNSRQTYLAAACLINIVAKLKNQMDRPSGPAAGHRIHRALSYIHQHFTEPLSIEKLAAMEHLSPSHFRVLFKSKTGVSPQYYLTSLRIRHACRMIVHEELNIEQAAVSVGYHDPQYFSRIFKSHTGHTPTEYKKINPE